MSNLSNNISDEELDHAIKIAARIVVLYGEVYLPIFNRLHNEIEKRKATQEKESKAFELAKQYADKAD